MIRIVSIAALLSLLVLVLYLPSAHPPERFLAQIRSEHQAMEALWGEAPALPPIGVPTCIRWGTRDPLFPYEWTDRLGETFSDLDLAPFEETGHFPHRERPDQAAEAIAAFFARVRA